MTGRGAGSVRTAAVVTLAVLTLLLSGCAAAVDGRALASLQLSAGIDPDFIEGSDDGEDDRLAAAALRDLELFWTDEYPRLAGGEEFVPVRAYFSVDSSRDGPAPPCTRSPTEIEGNAYYCPAADVIAYDRAALLPVLREQFGDSAVVVVLAHEYGHAVQERLSEVSPDAASLGSGAPTILSEGQADCYSGAFLRAIRDGATPDLRTGDRGVDAAMAALVTFRDPVGTGAGDADAHGNAFDRVSSFQDGFEAGNAACAAMTLENRAFTQQAFASLSDAETGGNLPLPDLLRAVGTDLDRFFAGLVGERGARWSPPDVVPAAGEQTGCGAGPVDLCPVDGGAEIAVAQDALGEVHDEIGDYASGTLLATRFALAALAALDRPADGGEAGRTAVCLAGAYTADVGAPGSDFGLSPGDLDEAVALLAQEESAASGADGEILDATAYARIADFRSGVAGGADACLAGV